MQNFGTQQKTMSLSRMYKISIELFYLQKTKLLIKFKANKRSKYLLYFLDLDGRYLTDLLPIRRKTLSNSINQCNHYLLEFVHPCRRLGLATLLNPEKRKLQINENRHKAFDVRSAIVISISRVLTA